MKTRKKNPPEPQPPSQEKSRHAVLAALEKKALDLVLLNVTDLSSFADYFLICSGRSARQVQAITDGIVEALKRDGRRPLGIEGYGEGKWVLIDHDDLIVHVFYEPIREFYKLESLWHEAPRVDLFEWEEEARHRAGS
jgi:ribosome-associated protein